MLIDRVLAMSTGNIALGIACGRIAIAASVSKNICDTVRSRKFLQVMQRG